MKLKCNDENEDTQIYIIGNGVIGKALAVALTLSGKRALILRGSVDQEPDYLETIEVGTEEQTLKADIVVSTLSKHEKLDGIILLTNKSFGNVQLAERLKAKAGQSPIAFLQNGLNIESSFLERGFTELYRCVLFATSQTVSENRIRFRPVASSPVGIITGTEAVMQRIVDEINTDIFSFRKEEHIQEIIWKKAITNCVFNSICPLLEIDNGVFHRNEAALSIAKTVISECITVSQRAGITLTEEDVLKNVLSISKMSEGQKISTYQDILGGRETEIETLNLEVARSASLYGALEVPATLLLGQMTKLKADLFKR